MRQTPEPGPDAWYAEAAQRTGIDVDDIRAAIESVRAVYASDAFEQYRRYFEAMADNSPAPPVKRHRPCPIHGPTTDTGGMCRPCARGGR